MKIVNTKKWLNAYIKSLEERNIFTSFKEMQNEHIAKPLQQFFPNVNYYEILHYLHAHGLSKLTNSNEIKKYMAFMEKNQIAPNVLKMLRKLQNEWQGPNVNVFLLPMDCENKALVKELGGKCGIGFSDKIVIFLSETVSKKGLMAVIAHEYHHVTRLKACNKKLDDFTLLDSLIIEGLAELAVKEYVGTSALAPWCSMYGEEELRHYWQETIKPNLSIIGKKHHHSFLYGESSGLPKWIGYAIGFAIVTSIKKNSTIKNTKQLMSLPSEKILEMSAYS